MKPNPQLYTFLAPYDKGVQQLTLQLRDYITDLVPQANELIWDNYNAVALAYSKSEKLKDFEAFPQEELKKMIWEAVGISEKLNPALTENTNPKSMVMSISAKKIRPNS